MGSVRLGRVGSHFLAHVMGWVGLNEKYCNRRANYRVNCLGTGEYRPTS